MNEPHFPYSLNELLMPACSIAVSAGQRIMEVYRHGFTVSEKADRSPVTTADLAAHELISRELSRLTPEIPILSEESEAAPFPERQGWGHYWLIDPLDGTRQFIERNGGFSVNIALIQGHQPTLGIVYAPAQEQCCYASRGAGAYHCHVGEEATRIHTRTPPATRLVVAGSRSYANRSLQTLLNHLGPHTLLRRGSAYKFCLVAAGEVDLYPRLGPTSEWDTAAGQCIVEEAGGQVVDTHFRPLSYNTKPSLENPSFFALGDTAYAWSHRLGSFNGHQESGVAS